jgi:hypothetical protein
MIKYVFTVWFVSALLKLSGFCFTQFGWNSDTDLIESAFRHEKRGGWPNTPAIGDLSAYLAKYPRCCSVEGSSHLTGSPILNTIFLRRFYTVTVRYPVADPTKNDGMPFYESILIMDCCGTYVPDSYGTGSKSAP